MTEVKKVGKLTIVFDGYIPGGMNYRGIPDAYCDAIIGTPIGRDWSPRDRCTRVRGHDGEHESDVNWSNRATIEPSYFGRLELTLENNHQSHSMTMSKETALALADVLRQSAEQVDEDVPRA